MMYPILTGSEQVIGTVLLVGAALGILVILAVVIFSRSQKSAGKGRTAPPSGGVAAERKKPTPKEPDAKKPVLLGSLAPEEQKRTAEKRREPIPERRDDTSIDKGYAAQHGMWVCGYCEVLNDNSLTVCQACGQPRSR